MTSFELKKYYGCDCVEVDEIDCENMLGYKLPALGKHTVRVLDSQNEPAVFSKPRNETERPKMIRQPYIDLILRDVKTGEVIPTRVWSAGVPMFMQNINNQLNGGAMGKTMGQLLDMLKSKDFSIWVEWDGTYGVQVRYKQP